MKPAVAVLLAAFAATALAAQPTPSVFESPAPVTSATEIDRIVFANFASTGVKPALCSDAVFVRRAYLDVIGTLPTAKEAREFIEDPDTRNKRRILIDRLLDRPEFAMYWAMKWGDILRIKAEFPVNLWPNAAQAYHRWVQASLASNKPYDRFARELLTSSGSNFRVGPVNFYRAIQNRTPEGIAAAVALAFMGSRVESWPKEYSAGTAVFFSEVGYKPTREWKEEIVFWDPLRSSPPAPKDASVKPATQPAAAPIVRVPQTAIFPDGTRVQLSLDRDPREVFADWLISSKNPWFARNISNRIWSWLLGRGIIHEPDDIRPDNPPSHPALLACLERELVANRYDLKHLYRLILNSQTYQMSSLPRSGSLRADASFARYPIRRLEAEVLIDAINKITGTSDLYTSAIPEPFTYIPENLPAVGIGDGSITSPFLSLFGRSARATGMENERANRMMPPQWLHLLNSSHIQVKLDQGLKLRALFDSRRRQSETITEIYLTILSRFPTPEELRTAEAYGQPGPPDKSGKRAVAKKREDWIDLAWALINSSEFLYRH